ncbi:MAG: (d)CMP kinase [Oscillospiraceae bacterium]|nr:(d)CMP kinase [Oscillospiraceae bacterium]
MSDTHKNITAAGSAVAIDGPVGAGKSTIAKECARRLGFVYMDTGALYRAVGVYCKENNIDAYNEEAVAGILDKISLEIKREKESVITIAFNEAGYKSPPVQRIILNDSDITGKLREPDVSMLASKVSSYGAVRAFLLDLQRDFAAKNNVIMDGRDIGTVILPNAKVKIFLKADPEERAKRRYDELKEKGAKITFDEVLADLQKRDSADSSRAHAPLKQAEDAVLLDTTGNTFEQSVEQVMEIINSKL